MNTIIVHLNSKPEIRQALAQIEVEPESIVNPYCTRRVGKKHIWEWRCHVELHGKRTKMMGHSNSAIMCPTKWWPVMDEQPLMAVRTQQEMREEAIMAVRGFFREKRVDPDKHVSAISALLALIIMSKDRDHLISDYWAEAIANTEIARFISAWEANNLPNDLLSHKNGRSYGA